MVGAGELFFERADDENGLHTLGNAEELNWNVTNETVEKNSSLNKKRALMQRVVTSTTATATVTLTEYNPYNLALGLFGTGAIEKRASAVYTGRKYVVPSAPGLITLVDDDGNRLYDAKLTNIVVDGVADTPMEVTSTDPGYTVANNPTNVVVTQTNGAVITFAGAVSALDKAVSAQVQIDATATTAGDFSGITVSATALSSKYDITVGTVSSTTVTNGTGAKFDITFAERTSTGVTPKFTINATVEPTSASDVLDTHIYTVVGRYVNGTLEAGKDYQASEQDLRAGLVRIMQDGKLKKGDTIIVNYTADEREFINVSMADASEIKGRLLYVSDNNSGADYVIEAWDCRVEPSGDMSGFIGTDFGSFQLTITLVSDDRNHPDYPLAKVTCIGRNSTAGGKDGIYDAKY